MNRDNYRSPARIVVNQEFHQTDDQANHAARTITQALQDTGYRAAGRDARRRPPRDAHAGLSSLGARDA
ncbi:hypothetical protein ABT173_25075 [Streptomyces sp. NPDC001795]|uniref:hypothetical protein n=1 Tax=unclassified Streptomyces TaxID=2593676 RepID=UPI00332824DB